jgi:hypothetical protein
MAIQFVKPIETEYDSQFMPLPLDTIYKNIETQQQGLDTARADLNKTQINLKGPFWAAQQGAETPIKDKYQKQVDELKERLEKDKGNYSVIASKLAEVNQKFQNDPEVQQLIRHEQLEKKNIDLAKIAGGTAFMPNIQYVDSATQEIKFKDWRNVKDEDIVAPVEDKTLEHVNKLVVEKLQEQYRITYNKPQAFVYKDPASGAYIVLEEPGTSSKKEIISSNPIISKAIKSASELLALDASGQGRILREFKENPFVPPVILPNGQQVIKRGYSSPAELEKFIEKAVDIVSYQRTEEKSPKYRVEIEGTALDAGSSGGGVSPQPIDYNYTIFQGPTVDASGASNYSQNLGDLQLSVERMEATTFNNYIKELGTIAAVTNGTGNAAYNVITEFDGILNELLTNAELSSRAMQLFRDGDNQGNEYTLYSLLQDKDAALVDNNLAKLMDELGEEGENKSVYRDARAKFFTLMNNLADSPDKATQDIAERFFAMNTEITDKKLVVQNLEKIEEQIGKTVISEALKNAEFQAELAKIYPDATRRNNVIEALKENNGDNNTALSFYKALGGDKYELSILDPSVGNYFKGIFSTELEQQYLGQARELTKNSKFDKLYSALDKFRQTNPVTAKIAQEEYIVDLDNTESRSQFKKFFEEQKDYYNNNPQNLLNLFQNYGYTAGKDIGKTNLNLNDVREVFNNATLKSPNFSLDADEQVKVSDINLGSLGESSLPIMYVTVKDKKGDSSTIPVTLPQVNKTDLAEFIGSFVADDNSNVQDKGAEIYARVLLAPSSISSVATALAITENSGRLKDEVIKFKFQNEDYAIKINGQNNSTIGKLTDPNDISTFAPLSETKTKNGERLPVNISNFSQFLRFMGYHQMQYLSDQGDLAAGESQRQRDATYGGLSRGSQMFDGQSDGNTTTTTSTTGAGGSTGGSLGKFRME